LPCLSMEAAREGKRLWPDGSNFNRVFPGSATGRPSEQLAAYLSQILIPHSDVVIDIHSGGKSLAFVPMSHMHLVQDDAQRRAMLDAMLAWNTDFHLLYVDIAGSGLLATEAESQGKIVVSTELGGGGFISPLLVEAAREGLRNVLRHLGILNGTARTREELGHSPATILDCTEFSSYVEAPVGGMYEPLVEPGQKVMESAPVGRLWSMEDPSRNGVELTAPHAGVLCAARAIVPTNQGDCVATVGKPVDRGSVLDGTF
jgi:predicted deacylase